MRRQVLSWLNETNYLDEMKKYIQLPSRSANKNEVKICGEMSQELLLSCGFSVQTFDTTGNQVIFGQSHAGDNKLTILIYGHYDVQPEGDITQWNYPPFEPVLDNGKLYGRGTADNKGQHFAHILALRYIRKYHPIVFDKINVKFILDGDEELGSFSLPSVIKNHQELLSCDFILVSDGPSLSTDAPAIVCSVRGIIDFELSVKHNKTDLHSGNFGGLARSATLDLIKILNSMINENGEVIINGFYDDVAKSTIKELEALDKLKINYDKIVDEYELSRAPVYKDRTNPKLNQLYPTLNINGLKSGGVGIERRTIIPSEAIASIDCRMVPNQKPSKIQKIITDHVNLITKRLNIEHKIKLSFGHAMDPIKSSIDSEYIDFVYNAALDGFGMKPKIIPRLGGSLPIYLFAKYLNKPVILLPLSLPDSKNHAPNENIDIAFFESGVATMVSLLIKLSEK